MFRIKKKLIVNKNRTDIQIKSLYSFIGSYN